MSEGNLTNEELRASPVSISGSVEAATDGLTDGQLRATPVAVAGTFFPSIQLVDGSAVTQPVSAVSLPLPTGGATAAEQATGNASAASIDTKTPILVSGRQPVNIAPSAAPAATKAVTATGTSGNGVTLTLPAVAGQFHYITIIEITKFNAQSVSGSSTPRVITSTNLPGNLAWTMGNAEGGTGQGSSARIVHMPAMPLRSLVANTPTTIVCPASTDNIWRINVYYEAAG